MTRYSGNDLGLAARRARAKGDEKRTSAHDRLAAYYAKAEDPAKIRERRQAARKGGK